MQIHRTPALGTAAAIDTPEEIVRSTDISPSAVNIVCACATDVDDLIRAAVARTFHTWSSLPRMTGKLTAILQNELKTSWSTFVMMLLKTLIERRVNTKMGHNTTL